MKVECMRSSYISMFIGTLTFSRREGDHSHMIDVRKTARHVVSVAVKRKAVDDICTRPNKMIDAELKTDSHYLHLLTTTDIEYIRHNAYTARKEVRPKQPKSIDEACVQLTTYQATTAKNENFLYHVDTDKKIVIFTCNTNVQVLRNSEVIYLDGTFQYCAKHFKQLFTLHTLQCG
jgi:hypothetical protein